jgi:undecaprenyl diphosphate synthase
MLMITHLGIIPDGSRRWAKKKLMPSVYGHKVGRERFRDVVDWCLEAGIKEVTFYTLSIQNFERDEKELEGVFGILREELERWLASNEAAEKGVQIHGIGQLGMLPDDVVARFKELEEKTAGHDKLIVNLAIGYGGREEIVHSVKELVASGESVSEENIGKHLWLQSEPDLIIRTSGELRTSNFLIWQAHYSEWYFTETYWPAFSKEEFFKAVDEFGKREIRKGK